MPDLIRSHAEPVSDPRASRRSFLKLAGLGGAVLVAAGCDSDSGNPNPDAINLDFSNDFGVLNYAYALEQLEAAFYATVVTSSSFSTTFNTDEQAVLRSIRKHEEIHREFLKAALGTNAIPGLTPNFDAVDFGNKSSVLGTAQVFEDLGVAAYNGAGKYISTSQAGRGYLTIAGKIVSVEGRHAAVIAGLITPNTIAASGIINSSGLDRALEPDVVLGMAGDFIVEDIRAINVPSLT